MHLDGNHAAHSATLDPVTSVPAARQSVCSVLQRSFVCGCLWVSLAFAIFQWLALSDRLQHLAVMLFKFGLCYGYTDVGRSSLLIFYPATAIGALLGLIAWRLTRPGQPARSISLAAAIALCLGAVLLSGLLATGLIAVAPR
jgi:hypothetical protein